MIEDRAATGADRVAGRVRYVDDIDLPGTVYAAFVHSTRVHARIVSADLSAALAADGVIDAISGQTTGLRLAGRALQDYPVLATDRVLFAGQRIAAVAADSREAAAAAAALVDVRYADLPPVLDVSHSRRAEAALFHHGYGSYIGSLPDRPSPNAQGYWYADHGNVRGVLDSGQHVISEDYAVDRSAAVPLESHSCLTWAHDGTIEVWATTKEPFNLRRQLAALCDVEVDKVLVHLVTLGGDFGAKGFPFVEAACCLLSMRTGRPVRHRMSFRAMLTSTSARHPALISLRTAVSAGRLCGVQANTTLDGGAFGGVKAAPMIVVPVIGAALGSYQAGAREERCVSYYTNSLPGGHVRSPGEFQMVFASESHVDTIARSLGDDPIAFRLRNARDDRVREVVGRVAAVTEAWADTRIAGGGLGIALCFRDTGPGSTSARCTSFADGRVVVEVCVPDQGAGAYDMFRRRAAGILGADLDAVTVAVVAAGADELLTDSGAGASRVTAIAGAAVSEACQRVRSRLAPDQAIGSPGWIPERLRQEGLDQVTEIGSAAAGWPAPQGVDVRSHGAVAVELTVDEGTGEIRLLRAAVVADTGRVLNPVGHRSQLEGGFVYGLSQALYERLSLTGGRVDAEGMRDYHLATASDIPPLEVHLVRPTGGDATPALSVGELVNVGVAPAIGNALFDAAGVRVTRLPLTPERVLRALWARPGVATRAGR